MKRLSFEDLAQMNQGYFKSLDKERLVEVAGNLHALAVEQLERLEQNSENSSKPPSSDNPYQALPAQNITEEATEIKTGEDETEETNSKTRNTEIDNKGKGFGKKPQGLQVGAKGIWRATPLVPNQTIVHHPETCAACNSFLEIDLDFIPHMGYYVLELEKRDSLIQVNCQLHHYYGATCECGHHTKAMPGVGYVSVVEGRKKNLCLHSLQLGRTNACNIYCEFSGTLPDVPTKNSRIIA